MKVAPIPAIAMVLALSQFTPTARAQETLEEYAEMVRALREEVRGYRSELDAVRASQGESWLNERRAEEVKALVHEVLTDAETRASLAEGGVTSGYKNGFFIGSEDGKFLLRTNIETQVRYIYNNAEQESGADENENGFVIRRARFDFRGHAYDPKLTYRLRVAADRADGDMFLEYAYLGYDFAKGWNIIAGQFKPLFAREEEVSAFRQLAVERSYVADYFSVDYTQGVEITYKNDWLRLAFSAHDGSYATNTEFNADRTNFAVGGRADVKLIGDDWKQFDDFTSWSGDKFAVLLGAAAVYEYGEEGSGTNTPDVFKWTADVSVEFGSFNLFAGVYGQSFSDNESTTGLPSRLDAADQIAFVVQGGFFVIPDKAELFARYEWIDFDGVYYRNSGSGTQGGTGDVTGENDLSLITIGVNYYIHKHNTKFTLDVVHALDPVLVGNTGSGIVASPDDGQTVIRAQIQWSF